MKPAAPRGRTPSADVERALIDAAETVLAREGPEGVTVRAVATEAGVAPMGIYNHLGGKDGLVDALLQRGFTGLHAALTETTTGDALERLMASGWGYRRFALEHPQHYAIMFERAYAADSASAAAERTTNIAFVALVDHVRAAMDAGYLQQADPAAVALQIFSAVHGAVSLELRGMIAPDQEESAFTNVLTMLARGLAASP